MQKPSLTTCIPNYGAGFSPPAQNRASVGSGLRWTAAPFGGPHWGWRTVALEAEEGESE
jgi:hypothetical protein